MSHNTRTIVFIAIALVVIGGIGYYNIKNDIAVQDGTDISEIAASGDKKTGDDVKVADDKTIIDSVAVKTDSKDEKVPITRSVSAVIAIPVPDLDRPIIFPDGYSAESAKEVTGQIAILIDFLKADSNRFNEWLDLGILRKSIEDYEGAREAWEYASAIRPQNSLSFVNLGMLYGYYLREPLRAEANLLHAIENEPLFLDFYMRMTDFYLEVMKDKGKAINFLDRAIEKYPEWEDLKKLRGHVGD